MGLRETVEVVRRARGEVRAEARDRGEIDLYHRRRVRELIAHAVASSPFHRERLGGATPAPGLALDRLPVMEKHDLVNRFDTVVADRRLTLETLQQHVSEMRGPAILCCSVSIASLPPAGRPARRPMCRLTARLGCRSELRTCGLAALTAFRPGLRRGGGSRNSPPAARCT